ncbi:bifunctional DNA primase/polymerase [Ruegeria arenilitoris]|uniref:bifunctional DNA primase/polymerase n=1 Tax=Ruegeria arenilitoris TaxID=1173585 RepID=UPI00147E0351|nr:bifunctional DNA primase/polymerase [Ruegeria arenilitoris]
MNDRLSRRSPGNIAGNLQMPATSDGGRMKNEASASSFPEALRLIRRKVPVFPCVNAPGNERHKRPATANGFKDATTDERRVDGWWGANPNALIGVPTGSRLGATVVDVDLGKQYSDDPKVREEGLAAQSWWDENKDDYKTATIVKTQSGGLHVFCQYKGERNTQGGIHRGVDRRGEGGYVIWWAAHGCAVLQQHPRAEWPVAPGNANGSGELGLMRHGMDYATMRLRTPKDGESAAEQMGDVLINLLIDPDEYHRNLQRMAFILANWFGQPMPKIHAFLEGVTKAAARTGRIDMNQYRKHMARVARIGEWYAAKAREERKHQTRAIIRGFQDGTVFNVIMSSNVSDLDELDALIKKRREEIQ